jgi:hypothetical protein
MIIPPCFVASLYQISDASTTKFGAQWPQLWVAAPKKPLLLPVWHGEAEFLWYDRVYKPGSV